MSALDAELVEMKRCKTKGLCCGAGGAQMFKEDEVGEKRINQERMSDVNDSGADIVASNCPFCLTMLSDGIKESEKSEEIMAYDLAELIIQNIK